MRSPVAETVLELQRSGVNLSLERIREDVILPLAKTNRARAGGW